MMPGMDGWAVLTALKRDPATAEIPVVMLTMVDDRNLGFALGATAYLTKPIDRAALVAVLDRCRLDPGQHRVLVVEDDDPTREMMVRTLRQEGWQVDEAAHGLEALERMEEAPADLLLVDLMMPVMDGFQLVEALGEKEAWRDVPVVIVTAKDVTQEDAARLHGSVERILRKGEHTREDLLREVAQRVRKAVR
jgi:CheY-like chemotaxis protein